VIGRGACAALALAGLAACGRSQAVVAPSGMTDAAVNRELQRCRGLGLKFYDALVCVQAQQERTKRFYAKPPESVR
jgi:hypothetical protein